ncbi:MAG: 1-acyl-sn-glycerol-3-phosphate acyltransferase, partial [Deltaproteobacteria bacterium]|nr:1-acyl-sn-glycerol-3-phosphate acyltransferase [Deltaproteobacteria bacterium]
MPDGPANQESAILQPVAMHDRYGPFLRSFFARYFNPIRFPAEAIDKIKQLDRQGNIVYLARSANTLHFLYLNHLCIRHGLPLARFVNGIDPILMQPIGLLLERMRTLGSDSDEDLDEEGEHLANRQLASVLAAGQASLLFLDKPATITSPGSPEHDGLLETLISSQQSQDKPIFLVPHLIFWDVHPEKESKALTDAVFGLPESPGFLRSMYLLLRYRRRAFVKVAEPINLLDFIKSQPDQNPADLAGSLQKLVENKISLEVFDVTGPRIRRDTEFKQAILHDSKITEIIESQADNDEAKTEAFKKKAYDILDEIAAEPRIRWPIYLDKALNFVWSRMYEGIVVDEADFEKIRTAIRKAPVIFCPSHKSHVDYLILSQLCMKYAIPMPHIAAGENLAFWPMGPIFRHSGAFFMRRSFKGNPLYPVIFRTYLRYVMSEGFPIEFFIEGTRSRTGKLLSPRFGILTWLIEAFEEGAGQDVNFIPISIDYEKIAESRSYVKELSGKDKEKEDVASLVKSSSHLKSKSKYGKIYVQIGDPISIKEYIQKRNYDLKNLSKGDRRALVQEIAYNILYRINEVSTVTPSALLAFSLLTHRRRGMSQEALEERAQWVVDWIRRRGHNRFSATLSDFPRALAEAASRFSRDGLIAMQHTGVELVYSPIERKRLALDYYRNNILHHFVSASLCALALESFSVEAVPIDALRDRIKELSRLFKFEFLFRSVSGFETEVQNAVKELAAEEAIKEEDGFVVKTSEAAQKRELFRAVTEHFVESYWLTAKSLAHLQKEPMFQKEFLARALNLGDRLFVQGELNFFESMNREAIKNALLTFADRKII